MVFAPRYCCCGKFSSLHLHSSADEKSRLILSLSLCLLFLFPFTLRWNVISDVVAIPLVNVGMYALMTEQFVSLPFRSVPSSCRDCRSCRTQADM
jgi:hypothetical protein